MKTDDLIRALVADHPARMPSPRGRLAMALAIALGVSTALFWVTMGPRDDTALAVTTPRFLLKFADTLSLLAGAIVILAGLSWGASADKVYAVYRQHVPAGASA